MTQHELNAAVAQATGESLATIENIGFSLVDETNMHDFDGEESWAPQIVDWDRPCCGTSHRPGPSPASYLDALASTTFA